MAKLSKAPVFYVVAQVVYSPILKLDSLVPELQDRLRKDGFPGYRALRQIGLEVHANADKPAETRVERSETNTHVFASRDQSESIVVTSQSVAYQTVEYDSIEAFQDKFSRAVRAVSEILAPDSFTRIGLRFLDAVVPPDPDSLDKYVRTQFLGLQNTLSDDSETVYTFSETQILKQGRTIKVRVLARAADVAYPIDLTDSAPPLPERFKSVFGVHALIDSDAAFGGESQAAYEFEVDAIVSKLRELKSDHKATFEAVVTPFALEEWA